MQHSKCHRSKQLLNHQINWSIQLECYLALLLSPALMLLMASRISLFNRGGSVSFFHWDETPSTATLWATLPTFALTSPWIANVSFLGVNSIKHVYNYRCNNRPPFGSSASVHLSILRPTALTLSLSLTLTRLKHSLSQMNHPYAKFGGNRPGLDRRNVHVPIHNAEYNAYTQLHKNTNRQLLMKKIDGL